MSMSCVSLMVIKTVLCTRRKITLLQFHPLALRNIHISLMPSHSPSRTHKTLDNKWSKSANIKRYRLHGLKEWQQWHPPIVFWFQIGDYKHCFTNVNQHMHIRSIHVRWINICATNSHQQCQRTSHSFLF